MSHAGLWLPPQFLAGDPDTTLSNSDFSFPSEFPYEFGLSSPESSDDGEEDFFAGLSRRLGQTSLHETRKQLSSTVSEIPRKTQGLVGSPQSTLAGIGSWSGRSAVSGDGSPNGYSRVPSPSTTPFDENNDPWEVIYAAAVQIARMKMNNNNQVPAQYDFHNNRRLLTHHCPNRSFNQVVRAKQQCGSDWGRPTKPNNYLVQQQQVKVQSRAREFGHESVNAKCTRPSAWPPSQVQQQNNRVQFGGSGSRVGGSSVKRGCGGTGVFLPRHYETPSEPRRQKTGCASVLLPAKVVHALNLNIDDLNGTTQPRFSNAFATDYEAILARRNALLMQEQQQQQQQQRLISVRREEAANYEIRLPQEWTY
ncbi:uncharacterized protein LOC114382721 [Glycine soja]|uniref:Uncharacterized protein n=1 Tax=Glycine soja TaxID=3848 RepID=A0A445HH70_GLYSO|nr:uncharacterized protein LOC114382721 [Glycine soja]RZB72929.1 hypothetical protein D0Y65_036927 [Glycine soja]